MFKIAASVTAITLALVLAIAAVSCARAQTPVTSSTTQSTGTTSSTSKGPSWGQSNIYTNEQYGFSFQYPKSWIKTDPVNDMVFYVLANGNPGADGANASVIDQAPDFPTAVKASYDNDPKLKSLGVQVKIESSRTTTLADAKTPAYETTISARIMGKYDFFGYALGTNANGKAIFIKGNTLRGATNRALVKEIAQTLTLQ